MRAKYLDKTLLFLTAVLTVIGFLIFTSASLSLLAKSGATFSSVAFSQIAYGIIGGSIALYLLSNVHYRFWRKYAFYIFVACVLLTILVFIPGIGLTYKGASRWIEIAGFSFQPAELLKIGFIIYLATFLSGAKNLGSAASWRVSLTYFLIVGAVGVIMLKQPDTDTFAIMLLSALAMFIIAGGRWRDVGLVVLAGIIGFVILVSFRPYLMDRITTFFSPDQDELGAGWQVQQSLIALGSGGTLGRGFGQSVQKFKYLPEPIGDSIFAVYGEEFGFLGTTTVIILFTFFILRGLRIASHSQDMFGRLLVVGFIVLIGTQAFLNIAAMLALLPLGGLPLPFISHGGTALLTTLASVGIILNVSKYQQTKKSSLL